MRVASCLISALPLTLACGSAQKAQSSTASKEGSDPSSILRLADGTRAPSAEVSKAWIVREPTMQVYADLRGLVGTPVFRGILPTIEEMVRTSASPKIATCFQSLAQHVDELAVVRGANAHLTILRMGKGDVNSFNVEGCITQSGHYEKSTPLSGATTTYRDADEVLAFAPPLLMSGDVESVKSALAGKGEPPSNAALAKDEYVVWDGRVGRLGAVRGRVVASDARFLIETTLDTEDATIAADVEDKLRAATTTKNLDADAAALVQQLGSKFFVSRAGTKLKIGLDLKESPKEQARDLGMMAAIGTYAVRKYLAHAKSAEARFTIGRIAESYINYWNGKNAAPSAKRRLIALPAVPREVPRATKYQTTASDWKAWEPIKFTMEEPQYYQYEVRATSGGTAVEILARGDLNGDGKTSLFKLQLNVDPKSRVLAVASSLEETDPTE